MNINREQIDELNAIIQIHLEPADYDKQVAGVLEDYRKKVRMDGFRPGKVPAGLIKKLYGQAALVDEINKILSDSLNNYIRKEALQILGEPIPNPDSPEIDWEHQREFDFHFDIGLSPEFELKLTKRDKVPLYKITVSDEMIDNQIESHTKRYGLLEPVEIASPGDLLYVSLVQLDEQKNEVENGIHTNDTLVSPDSIEDKALKEQLNSCKVNDEFEVDLKILFPNENDRATALMIDKSHVDEIGSGPFKMTVQQIKHFVPAEINQDLFDKIFGEGEVTSEEIFRERILE
ncbi:MAG: trigger factor, partial [Bacteroidales bacterium]|nr:trigger factor [Bacteroidales bacterium]